MWLVFSSKIERRPKANTVQLSKLSVEPSCGWLKIPSSIYVCGDFLCWLTGLLMLMTLLLLIHSHSFKKSYHRNNSLGESIAPSAIPQARKRLKAKPLKSLFSLTVQHWTQSEDSEDTWFGLRLFSVDETLWQPSYRIPYCSTMCTLLSSQSLTSLTDRLYDLQSLLNGYFERWEVESSYGEIKHDM